MPIRCDIQQDRSISRLLRLVAVCLTSAALLAGCATAKHFNKALEEPAEASGKAADVVESAAADVLRANALGLVESPPDTPDELVCATQEGLRASAINLRQFNVALEAVDDVATKPDDVSFAGYIAQIRKNKEALAAAGEAPGAEQQAAEKQRQADYNRCKALFPADWNAGPRLTKDGAMQLHGITPTLGIVLAFRDVALALLQYGEAAQREAAIRATVARLVPQLKTSVANLRAPVNGASFGSRVVYAAPAPGQSTAALEMNKSNLGAAVSIQRWMTAMQLRADWESLAPCRAAKAPLACLGKAEARATAADFAAQVAIYRNLAKIDDKKVLDALDAAVAKAEKASSGQASLADILDALFGIGDAVADVAGKVDAVKEARN